MDVVIYVVMALAALLAAAVCLVRSDRKEVHRRLAPGNDPAHHATGVAFAGLRLELPDLLRKEHTT